MVFVKSNLTEHSFIKHYSFLSSPHLDNYVSSILPDPSRKTTHTDPIPDHEGFGIYVTESQIM